jgi:hypothetical protein
MNQSWLVELGYFLPKKLIYMLLSNNYAAFAGLLMTLPDINAYLCGLINNVIPM